MNRREFYKQLMKEYTFDETKVRRFAKHSTLSRSHSQKDRRSRLFGGQWWYLPSTAAVAAVALTIGVFSVFMFGEKPQPPFIPEFPVNTNPADSRTLDDRMNRAALEAQTAVLSFETKNLYLSFGETITLREMQNALESVSDTGNIVVELVYLLGGESEVEALAVSEVPKKVKTDAAVIVGAKISAPAVFITDLNRQSEVVLVEIEADDINDETFVPLSVAVPDISAAVTATPTTAASGSGASATSGGSGSGGTPPAAPVRRFVELDIAGAVSAEFIGNTRFAAAFGDSVALYEINRRGNSGDNYEVTSLIEFSAENIRRRPSATGDSLMFSGIVTADDETRSKVLIIADAATETLDLVNLRDLIGLENASELVYAFYDDSGSAGRIVLRVRTAESNTIYVISKNTLEITTAFEAPSDSVILGLSGNSLYYAVFADPADESSRTRVCVYSLTTGASESLRSFRAGETVAFERSRDLSRFAVNVTSAGASTVRIFDAESGTMSRQYNTSGSLIFYRGRNDLLTDGTGFFLWTGNDSAQDSQATAAATANAETPPSTTQTTASATTGTAPESTSTATSTAQTTGTVTTSGTTASTTAGGTPPPDLQPQESGLVRFGGEPEDAATGVRSALFAGFEVGETWVRVLLR